jgi:hypothetical protein
MGLPGLGNMARRRGVRQVITGSILFAVGLLITIFTLSHGPETIRVASTGRDPSSAHG